MPPSRFPCILHYCIDCITPHSQILLKLRQEHVVLLKESKETFQDFDAKLNRVDESLAVVRDR